MAHDILEYEVHFTTRSSLVPDDEPSEYVIGIEGVIVARGQSVGSLRASVVQIARAHEAGEDIADVFDTEGSLFEAFEAVVNARTGWIKDRFDCSAGLDLLHIDRVEVDAMHRGRSVGLLAVLRLLEAYGGGCGVATGKPFPLQHEGRSRPAEPVANDLRRRDLRRLSAHWRKLGFVPVRGSKVYALALSLRRPGYRELVAPVDE